MTIQHITLTVAATLLGAAFLWVLKIALTPKKQAIVLKSNQQKN